jgi:heme exporter protein B
MNAGRIGAIIVKESKLELRRKNALYGILLFCAVLVFLIYKSFNTLKGLEWDVMLWTTLLFCGINAIAKSFVQDGAESRLYFYTLFDPKEVIVGKLLYNFFFLTILFLLVYLGFSFFFKAVIRDYFLFFEGACLGVLGLSIIFTFIASVSSQSEGNQGVLMSVMSLPLTLPVLLLLIKTTAVAMRLISDTSVGEDLKMLAAIDMLLAGILLLLFDFLWKD